MSQYSIALEKQLETQRIHVAEISSGFRPDARSATVYMAAVTEIATPFFVSRPIAEMVKTASESMPDWILDEAQLEAPFGFVWLENPLPLPDALVDGESELAVGDLTALAWGHCHVADDGEVFLPSATRSANTVAVATYVCADHIVPRPRVPLMVHWLTWHHGYSLSRAIAEGENRRNRPTTVRAVTSLKFWAALVQFMTQRILRSTPVRVDRATRRRLPRGAVHEPLINVIELRRPNNRPTQADSAAIEWSCQWLVRGHWRQQWYPKLERHQPKWITPYVKGPEDKPLKQPRATVFAVVR